jgi:UDP-N-acetylglucosamine 2-epimerase (non-hydrolysing)/GDP/UDP-N,N'-diacetylbacillosamine 2-epimerase (hydrolysing)
MVIATSPVRTICIVTGARADYGLLSPLIKQIAGDSALRLQVIATGAHLSPEFGLTRRDIEADGVVIDAAVEMQLSSDSRVGTTKSMGLGMIGFADALERLKPDVLVLLGDRFEILAAAQAALIARIPIAHIHGGELSEGAFDDSIRHAITKMAHWHFVAAEPYRKRVIQLGEDPRRVFSFGAPGLDWLAQTQFMQRTELERELGMTLRSPLLLVTYHPATLGRLEPQAAMSELLAALDEFPDASVILSYPNADACGRELIALAERWIGMNTQRARAFASLGTRRYLSALRLADAIVGNSSSALIEAPALQRATVNIGDRQRGRLKAASVIDVTESRAAIVAGIRQALSEEFRATLPRTQSAYGSGDVSRRIKDALKTADLAAAKVFFDVEHRH